MKDCSKDMRAETLPSVAVFAASGITDVWKDRIYLFPLRFR